MPKRKLADIKEYFYLLGINLSVHQRNFVEFLRVAKRYYLNKQFIKVDTSLLLSYLLNSPFDISKEFLREKGEKDIYAYGETPLTTLEQIAKECRITQQDKVFELGCGRGRSCFWLNSFTGCKVVGIEFIPEFVDNANALKAKFGFSNVEFRRQNMLDTDFSEATVIYLYGTSLDNNAIHRLIERFKGLPSGTKIITVSYPLTDFASQPIFEVMKRFEARFTWGTTDVYLQIKK